MIFKTLKQQRSTSKETQRQAKFIPKIVHALLFATIFLSGVKVCAVKVKMQVPSGDVVAVIGKVGDRSPVHAEKIEEGKWECELEATHRPVLVEVTIKYSNEVEVVEEVKACVTFLNDLQRNLLWRVDLWSEDNAGGGELNHPYTLQSRGGEKKKPTGNI